MSDSTQRYTSLDDIVIELSADLDAATKALTEPTLCPKRPGRGLDAIRERIRREFSKVHDSLARDMRVAVPDIEVVVEETPRKPAPVKAEKSLAENAEVILRNCEQHRPPAHRHLPHGVRCYWVVPPVEDADTLIRQALKAHTPRKEATR